jgi:hypothetical protein
VIYITLDDKNLPICGADGLQEGEGENRDIKSWELGK